MAKLHNFRKTYKQFNQEIKRANLRNPHFNQSDFDNPFYPCESYSSPSTPTTLPIIQEEFTDEALNQILDEIPEEIPDETLNQILDEIQEQTPEELIQSVQSNQSGAGGRRLSFTPKLRGTAFKNHLRDVEFYPDNPTSDILEFLLASEQAVKKEIQEQLEVHHGVKCWLILKVQYKEMVNKTKIDPVYIRSNAFTVHSVKPIDFHSIAEEMLNSNANHLRNKSGLTVDEVLRLDLQMAEYNPLSGGSYKPLPKFIRNKHIIVNVNNTDERCFGYAILASKYDFQNNPQRPQHYNPYFTDEHLDELKYPINPFDVPKMEDQLNLKINLFSFFDDEGQGRYPLYISQRETFLREINLLYWDGHYAWIRNINGLFFDLNNHHGKKFLCLRCLGHFESQELLDQHSKYCTRENFTSTIYILPEPGTSLKFINIKNQMKSPFVIYADFECYLQNIEEEVPSNCHHQHPGTLMYQHHNPCAVGLRLIAPDVPILQNHLTEVFLL